MLVLTLHKLLSTCWRLSFLPIYMGNFSLIKHEHNANVTSEREETEPNHAFAEIQHYVHVVLPIFYLLFCSHKQAISNFCLYP